MNDLGRIKDEIDLRRLRLKDIFFNFDIHNTKVVSKEQFLRCLGMNKIDVTEDEKETLFRLYCTNDGFVAYKLFVKDMEKTIPSQQITSDNTFGETMSRKLLPPGSVESKEDRHMEQLSSALGWLKNRAKTHGLIVKNFFFDFDRVKTGYVTEMQFRRGLKLMVDEFPQDLVDVLVEHYGYQTSSRVKDVNYDALQKDIDKYKDTGLPDFPWTTKLYHQPIDNSYTDDEIQELFWKKVEELRIRPKDYFQLFDKLCTGFVTVEEFKRVVAMCRLNDVIDPELLSRLGDRYYKPENHKINYMELMNKVKDMTFTRSVEHYESPLKHGLDRTSVLLPPVENEVDPVLDRIRDSINRNRMNYNVKDLFSDFDRVHEEHITPMQFDRVLKRFDLLPTNERDLALLHQRFHAEGGDHPRINYKHFLEWVDPTPKNVDPEFVTNRLPPEPIIVPEGVLEILKKYREKISKNRVRLSGCFDEYDKLKHGKITAHQFEVALNYAGLEPTFKEIQDLTLAYAAPQKEDFSQIYVCYQNFIKDIDVVFNEVCDPVIIPNANSLNTTSSFPTLSYFTDRLEGQEKGKLLTILSQLRDFTGGRRILMTPDFQHYDLHHSSYVTKPQFERVCKDLKLLTCISYEDLQIICKAFAMPHRDSRDDVNYEWFVKALETFQFDQVITSIPSVYDTFKPPFNEPKEVPIKPMPLHTAYGPIFLTYKTNQLLNKLRYQIKVNGIRLKSLFEDFVTLRLDYVPKSKLRTALGSAGFVLLDDEWKQLEELYEHGTKPECVEWRKLIDELQEPMCESKQENEVDLFDQAMKVMKHTMMSQTINAKPTFQCFDRQNIGRVTLNQFNRALVIVGLSQKLTPEQVDAVARKYVTNERDTRQMADYVTFIHDVENYYDF